MVLSFLLPLVALLSANVSVTTQGSLSPFEALEERGTADTFLTMMQLSGLRATLEASDAPYTLLPPVDTAFVGVPPEVKARLLSESQRDVLRDLLNDHVLLGSLASESFVGLRSVPARSGLDLPVGFQGGRLTLRGVPIAAAASTTPFQVEGGAIIELDGLILKEPSVLEVTRARRLAARGLRLASELPQEGGTALATLAARSSILEIALAGAHESASEAELVLLGPVPARADSLSTADYIAQLRAPLIRLLGRPTGKRGVNEPAQNVPSTSTRKDDVRPIFVFIGEDPEASWSTPNGDGPGSRSKYSVKIADGRLLFQGTLNPNKNGGIASIRSEGRDYDFRGMTGLRLRVKTDGREYGASVLAGDRNGRTRSWRKSFQVPEGEWTTVDIPFKEMVLNLRGAKYPQVGPPNLAEVRSFSFVIGDHNTTRFQMEVDSISAYR